MISSKFIFLILILNFSLLTSQKFNVNNINYYISYDNKATVMKGNYNGNIIIPSKITINKKDYVVDKLGYDSFSNCTNLTSIKLPETIKVIDIRSFEGCIGLRSINLPSSLVRLETAVFFKCQNLKKIYIPENVEYISNDAFSYCDSLNEIDVNPNNKYYSSKDNVLYDKNFNFLIKVPTNKISFQIPETITKINSSAFENCNLIEKINIPLSVTEIPDYSFWNCQSLKELNLHKNLKYFGFNTLVNCDSLQNINVDTDNNNYISFDGVLYNKDVTEIIKCPPAKNFVQIPKSVKTIGTTSFSGCKKLKEVTIPENIDNIKIWAFTECPSLKKL